MGTIYSGPYADQINAYDHEGFADRRMPDGSFTGGEWSTRYPVDKHVAFTAACNCGWRGTTEHPATDAGEDAAYDQWRTDHLRPRLDAEARRHTITGDQLLTYLRTLRAAVPAAAADEDVDYARAVGHYARGAHYQLDQLDQFLDDLAHQSKRGRS